MRLLLDTHSLLWALYDPSSLSSKASALISNPNNQISVSVASLWEIEIKHRKKPASMPYSAEEALKAIKKAGYHIVSITPAHICLLASFMEQNIHNDPFDHLLLAVSVAEQMSLLTHDSQIRAYQNALIEAC